MTARLPPGAVGAADGVHRSGRPARGGPGCVTAVRSCRVMRGCLAAPGPLTVTCTMGVTGAPGGVTPRDHLPDPLGGQLLGQHWVHGVLLDSLRGRPRGAFRAVISPCS